MNAVTFLVPGRPKGKARPRLGKHGNVYTPRSTKQYEHDVALAFECVSPRRTQYGGAVRVECWAAFNGRGPDLDNVLKLVCDALNQVAYQDDGQVTRATIRRVYGGPSRLVVRVTYGTEA